MTTAADVAAALCGPPAPLPEAETRVPRRSGLYGWWSQPGVIPDIQGPPHPTTAELQLLYVGIAGSLFDRVVDRHVRGSTGASTLRRSLAALLLDSERLQTRWTTTRVVLVRDDERRLTAWMRGHLLLTWCEHPDPEGVEPAVIKLLAPPLNLDHNSRHPARDIVKAARSAWRASAGPRP